MQVKHSFFSNVLIFIVSFIGMMALAGWYLDWQVLKRPVDLLPAMNPMTAICFILLGFSFYTHNMKKTRPQLVTIGNFSAFILVLLSIAHLSSSLTGWQVDQVLFSRKVAADTAAGLPSRMAITTAINFIGAASCIWLLHRKVGNESMPAHLLALAIFFFALFSLLGYLYNAPEFYHLIRRFPMAANTACCFILYALAVLYKNPHTGITGQLSAKLSGGYIARILLPVAILMPALLGFLYLFAYNKHLFSVEFGMTLLIMLIISVFCYVIWVSAMLLNRKDILKIQAEEKLQQIEDDFRTLATSIKDYAIFMIDADGKILTWNKGAELIKGYTEDEIKGCSINIFYTEEEKRLNIPALILRKAKELGSYEMEGYRVRKDNSTFWATVLVTALFDKKGDLRGYAKVTRDSTENKMTKDILSNFNTELNKQVIIKTAILEKTTHQLRQLAAHLQTVREEEREKIAREIHDQLGQLLSRLKMDIIWLKKSTSGIDSNIGPRIDKTLELLNETHETMRRIATDLHPSVLHNLGLSAAIHLFSRQFQERSGINILLNTNLSDVNDRQIPHEIAIGLYRIFQESLTNTFKHAQADKIYVWLYKDRYKIVLGVEDNGKGFDTDKQEGKVTLGLISIRERVLMLNGEYMIESSPGDGTRIEIKIPINQFD
ncbi:MAG: hypothetical protein DI539_23390 [Flavobacterium psychrophilum]|nr:MAG: hypothetical protein DI539_23390 [Flavobacterium psychrophilum]